MARGVVWSRAMAYLGLAQPEVGTPISDEFADQWGQIPQSVEYKVISGAVETGDLEMALNFAALDGWAVLLVVPMAEGPSNLVLERRRPVAVDRPA